MNKIRKRFINEINETLLTLKVDVEEDYISKDYMWDIDLKSLTKSIETIKEILLEEQDAYDNIPVSLRTSARGDDSAHAIMCMSDAIKELQKVNELLLQWPNTSLKRKRTSVRKQMIELIESTTEGLQEILY